MRHQEGCLFTGFLLCDAQQIVAMLKIRMNWQSAPVDSIRELLCLLALALILILPVANAEETHTEIPEIQLGRGINIGGIFEAPVEGGWGLDVDVDFFDAIADAGFDSIRIPIRWSSHTESVPPFRINETFFKRIDWVLDQAERVKLAIVINVHHYEEYMEDPPGHQSRFLSIWEQISERYANRSKRLHFELLNEPSGRFNEVTGMWNRHLADAIDIVRQKNPDRMIVVGPVEWNSVKKLNELVLPDDPNIVVTVHFYDPFKFTHQGAHWTNNNYPRGVKWDHNLSQLGVNFDNWSWQTTVLERVGYLNIQFHKKYAGFNMRSEDYFAPHTLTIELQGESYLDVQCGQDSNLKSVHRIFHETDSWKQFTIDMRNCNSEVNNLVFQNLGPSNSVTNIRSGSVCFVEGCLTIIGSAGDRILRELDTARRWGKKNQRHIYIGEFGVHKLADIQSRVLWVSHVKNIILEYGMSSAYWDFGSEFGIYDVSTKDWQYPLLNALIN